MYVQVVERKIQIRKLEYYILPYFCIIYVLASFLKIAIVVNPYDLQGLDIEDIIKEYFLTNLPYTDMLYFLAVYHKFDIFLCHLHRLLRKHLFIVYLYINKSTYKSI